MRSSKSRSRSKPNRNRSVGNVVNRVFDSSGPEGKVRGTPQQIIDKYNQLARDAQLAGDRVAMENFQQHSEHYTRMLAEAQREQEARREAQEQQHRDRQQQNQHNQPQQPQQQPSDPRDERGDRNEGGSWSGRRDAQGGDDGQQPKGDSQPRPQPQPQPDRGKSSALDADTDVIDVEAEDTGLVDTPESKPTKPRARRPRKSSSSKPNEQGGGDGGATEAAE